MKTLNAGKILLLLMVVIGLSSCGDEYYTDDYLRNSDEKLCNRVWVEEYETNDNELCEHYLEFSRNGSGKETFKYKPIDGRKPYESSYRFDWAWIDNSMEGLILDYGGNASFSIMYGCASTTFPASWTELSCRLSMQTIINSRDSTGLSES